MTLKYNPMTLKEGHGHKIYISIVYPYPFTNLWKFIVLGKWNSDYLWKQNIGEIGGLICVSQILGVSF